MDPKPPLNRTSSRNDSSSSVPRSPVPDVVVVPPRLRHSSLSEHNLRGSSYRFASGQPLDNGGALVRRQQGSVDPHDDSSASHEHCHIPGSVASSSRSARNRLIIASILCLVFMVGEIVGGYIAGSLAVLTDAAHLLTDFASFMISLFSLWLGARPATKRMSFGWYRAEVIGALTSVIMIWVITGILVYEAVQRIRSGEYEINPSVMLITAGVGVAFNIVMGVTLHDVGHHHGHSHGHGHGHGHDHGHSHDHGDSHEHGHAHGHEHDHGHAHDESHVHGSRDNLVDADYDVENLGNPGHVHVAEGGHSHGANINVRAAFIHVIGDFCQSIGVLIAAYIIYYKPEYKIVDPICTFLFSVLVLFTTMAIMRDTLNVLMEGIPPGIDFNKVRDSLQEIPGVARIHNLRIWALTMDKIALSAHLAIEPNVQSQEVLRTALIKLRKLFNIHESTLQIEDYHQMMVDCQGCQEPRD